MKLDIKRPDHIVPSYSLTGDLLSYLRCNLQYRFYNGSALPPSRPVQQWFGELLHGTLELAFRFWKANGAQYPLPWPANQREWNQEKPDWKPNDIGLFADTVEIALRHQGKQARNRATRDSAFKRVAIAINEIGPHLFPLIAAAEKKVIGTRSVPGANVSLRCLNYEVHGVIDVLTNVTLGGVGPTNLIRASVGQACPNLAGAYEVIVDYKGSPRPRTGEPYWEQGLWQIQTYAWLRSRQPDSLPVAAGILLYVNELTPGDREMAELKSAIRNESTDVLPVPNSRDDQVVRLWRKGNSTDQLSLDFRLRRAIRVIPVTGESTKAALHEFDDVVRRAEENIIAEAKTGSILDAWQAKSDEPTCAACDFRWFCPSPEGQTPSIKAP